MTTIHIITDKFPPTPGGLEQWTCDLATTLTRSGFSAVVYVCENGKTDKFTPLSFEVVSIATLRRIWEEPLGESGTNPIRIAKDRSRLNYACVKAAVVKRLGRGPNLLLSNFITTAGFIAHLVAGSLKLPHIALFAGSDFSRDFHSPSDHPVVLEVCKSATVVVGKNYEQVRTLLRHHPDGKYRVIETSVTLPEQRWRPSRRAELLVMSDCGFSFKKGTGILMDAFDSLRHSGITAKLLICGSDQNGQESYWAMRRADLSRRWGSAISFPGYLNAEHILDHILTADIYASATLGEGSSAARARALCAGIPMLTTNCGELADSPPAPHIKLVTVADAEAFGAGLIRLAQDVLSGELTVPQTAVDHFCERFSPLKEWTSWVSLIEEISAGFRETHASLLL